MPVQIRWVAAPPLHADGRNYDGTVDFSKLELGDLCFFHHGGKPCTERSVLDGLHLTAHYFQHNAARPPLILAMPESGMQGKRYFMVDGQCYSRERGYYDGWTVSGEPPLITVSPSVDFGAGRYHGFVQNGVIGNG